MKCLREKKVKGKEIWKISFQVSKGTKWAKFSRFLPKWPFSGGLGLNIKPFFQPSLLLSLGVESKRERGWHLKHAVSLISQHCTPCLSLILELGMIKPFRWTSNDPLLSQHGQERKSSAWKWFVHLEFVSTAQPKWNRISWSSPFQNVVLLWSCKAKRWWILCHHLGFLC